MKTIRVYHRQRCETTSKSKRYPMKSHRGSMSLEKSEAAKCSDSLCDETLECHVVNICETMSAMILESENTSSFSACDETCSFFGKNLQMHMWA